MAFELVNKPTVFDSPKKIIATLPFERISRNDKGEVWQVSSSYLAVVSKLTVPSVVPDKFEFLGWYRFLDEKNVGPNTKFIGGFQQAVSSNDAAKMRVVDVALSDILLRQYEECDESLDVLPHRLFIISSSASLKARMIDLLTREPEPWPTFAPVLRRHLQLMRSVDACITSKETLRAIYKLAET